MRFKQGIAILCFASTTLMPGCDKTNTSGTTPDPRESNTDAPIEEEPMVDQEPEPADYEVADAYTGLRDLALGLQADTIGLNDLPATTVYAILMETGYPEAVASLLATSDGAVSLYFSNGGGIIGAGEHEPVRAASADFLELAQEHIGTMTRIESYPLPRKDFVRFYLLTPGGVYTAEVKEDDLGHMRHACSPLFHKGHDLITAVRTHTPQ